MGIQERCSIDGSKTFVLKFDMHCRCKGCVKKVNDGVKEISRSEGVERADVLMVGTTGEVKVTGRMDPEKARCLFHAVTKKCVGIGTLSDESAGAGRWPSPVTPSAPPLPDEEEEAHIWSKTTTERCWYRWSSASSSVVWAAPDITGTLAMYDL